MKNSLHALLELKHALPTGNFCSISPYLAVDLRASPLHKVRVVRLCSLCNAQGPLPAVSNPRGQNIDLR